MDFLESAGQVTYKFETLSQEFRGDKTQNVAMELLNRHFSWFCRLVFFVETHMRIRKTKQTNVV